MLCRGLLYVVCWYVGVLPLKVGSCGRSRPQDVDFALRRSCLVVKITMYIHFCAYMCTFFLVVAFRDARFLSGLYGRFSYIVAKMSPTRQPWIKASAGLLQCFILEYCSKTGSRGVQ